ncbi:MAG: hypothetical protein ACI4LD_00855 [Lentihominibacter sp.]
MGSIRIVSQTFLPGIFFFVSRYAKKTPKKKAIMVAIDATFKDKITGSNIIWWGRRIPPDDILLFN